MKFILVIERKHLFAGLSPQGWLDPGTLDLNGLGDHLFFAQRDFMENNAHFLQIIPYLILQRGQGEEQRVLVYQRRVKHPEQRLGGLWSVGFGGHIEPMDLGEDHMDDPDHLATQDLVEAAAVRELAEETGLDLGTDQFRRVGFINSDGNDVSSVHFGVVYRVDLDAMPGEDAEILTTVVAQAEPHRALWLPVQRLRQMLDPETGPDGGSFEDWSRIAVPGIF